MSEASTSPIPVQPKKNHAWIYFFAFLFVSSVGVAIFMIMFNLWIQLKPEKLDAAMKLWKEKGPKSYKMVYTKRINDDPRVFTYTVTVKNGSVIEVLENQRRLEAEKTEDQDPRGYHSMDALFRDIDRYMTIDKKPGAPKVYVRADFDPETGALIQYIRRVMGATQRVELNVRWEATAD